VMLLALTILGMIMISYSASLNKITTTRVLSSNGNENVNTKPADTSDDSDPEKDADFPEYEAYLNKNGKSKDNDKKKLKNKKLKYKENKGKIDQSNLDETKGFKLELNKFADMEDDEKNSFLTHKKLDKTKLNDNAKTKIKTAADALKKPALPVEPVEGYARMEGTTGADAAIDWRKGTNILAHAVQDQLACGSCWAFVGELLLSAYDKKINKRSAPVIYSAQQLIDCIQPRYGETNSCVGGHYWWAAYYSYESLGIATNDLYPYKSAQQTCSTTLGASTRVSILKDFNSYDSVDQATLYTLLTYGPIGVPIDASAPEFLYYKSGIVGPFACNPNGPNHAVVVVGYGYDTVTKKAYWILQNSWGTAWGELGYMRILRDVALNGWTGCYMYTDVLDVWA